MGYYDDKANYEARGIDYDLVACLQNNPQGAFTEDSIEKVLAVWEGENDGDDWRWVLQLKPDADYGETRYVYLQGGCDYTGWDCQSSADHAFYPSALEAANALSYSDYHLNTAEVTQSLVEQVNSGKLKTWREEKDAEFGL